MSKISTESAAAFVNGQSYNNNNTAVYEHSDAIYLTLFGNIIASKKPGGNISITLAGWNTQTTRSRLNALPGVHVTTKQGQAYLNGEKWDGKWITL